MKYLLVLVVPAVFASACGGGKQPATTPSGPTGEGGEVAAAAGDGDFVSPEQMDEINRSLYRKRTVVSRCLATAVDNKELPKNARGKITLEIVIVGGKAETVKPIKTTLESTSLAQCVVNHVKAIQFPELPNPYETSYTYGFEAM